jgi:hypothetical protein
VGKEIMKREFLEDYEQKEKANYEKTVMKRLTDGAFDFEKDKYPPDERFIKMQRPMALAPLEIAKSQDIWAQIPFCGSLVIGLAPFPQAMFEEKIFRISEIPKIIDFIKETGRLQVVLTDQPTLYENLDYLDPFFKELKPAYAQAIHPFFLGTEQDVNKALTCFNSLAKVKLWDLIWRLCIQLGMPYMYQKILKNLSDIYLVLKLTQNTLAEDIENYMVDDPRKALILCDLCARFIIAPIADLRYDQVNYPIETLKKVRLLPVEYQPHEIHISYEIGKLLLRKLTYAPEGMMACNALIDHYESYDLQKLLEQFNNAIRTNHPDILLKNVQELSLILDNVWNDESIPKLIKGLRVGIAVSMSAIGCIAAGPLGGAIGGFLAGMGLDVADRFADCKTEGLSERAAKLLARSWQANIYDFKRKYKVQPTSMQK